MSTPLSCSQETRILPTAAVFSRHENISDLSRQIVFALAHCIVYILSSFVRHRMTCLLTRICLLGTLPLIYANETQHHIRASERQFKTRFSCESLSKKRKSGGWDRRFRRDKGFFNSQPSCQCDSQGHDSLTHGRAAGALSMSRGTICRRLLRNRDKRGGSRRQRSGRQVAKQGWQIKANSRFKPV